MTNEFNTAATRLDFAAIFGAAAGSFTMQDVGGKGLVTGLADQGVQLVDAAPKNVQPAATISLPGLNK